jgi:membrane associated rhomboid family serine protease
VCIKDDGSGYWVPLNGCQEVAASPYTVKTGTDTICRKADYDFSQAEAGLDSMSPGETTLRTHYQCHDLRGEFYRIWTYQYTHYKIPHIGGNVIMNIFLGWRLNKLNGNAYMSIFYWLGVIGGSFIYFVWDVHRATIGMSGGCYSLLGQRFGYLAINWNQKKYAVPEFILLICMIGIDVVNFAYTQVKEHTSDFEPSTQISHAVHSGGLIMGFLLVVIWGVDISGIEEKWDRIRKYVSFAIFCGLWGFCIVFRMTCWTDVSGLWDLQNSDGYCWLQLVYNRSVFGDSDWHCVQCHESGASCPVQWQAPIQQWTANVSYQECTEKWKSFCVVNSQGAMGDCFSVE